MRKVEIGDKLLIHCYKHDGKIHRVCEETIVLEKTDDYLICANNRTKVTESDGRTHRTKEPAILFFYKHNWFNVIAQFKDFGLFYYCNISSPYVIDDKYIKYIDYDLDLRVFPDGGYRILDKNEYKYHRRIMNYSDDLDIIINRELEKLIEMKNKKIGPFDIEELDKYYKQYLGLEKLE